MNARLINTVMAIEDWQQQWMLIRSIGIDSGRSYSSDDGTSMEEEMTNRSDEQCRRLLQLIPLQSAKVSVFYIICIIYTCSSLLDYIVV